MTDQLPDWDYEPPRHAALDARVREVLLHAVRQDNPAYLATLRHLYMDCDETLDVLLMAFTRVFCATVIACQGQELTVNRLEADIKLGREAAVEEAS